MLLLFSPADESFTRNADVKLLIGPKQQSLAAGGCMIDPATVSVHELGRTLLYFTFGTARYGDVVNPSTMHRTEFCFVLALTGSKYADESHQSKDSIPSLGIDSYPCQYHNCADDECERADSKPLPP